MKQIPTEFLVPGMTLEEDVLTENNQLVATRATILTEKLISRLEFYNIASVKISTEVFTAPPVEEKESKQTATDESILEEGYSKKIKSSEGFQTFSKNLDSTISTFSEQMADILEDENGVDTTALFEQTMSIVPKDATTLNVFDLIHNTRQHKDPIYAHSVNVALICNILGRWLKFSDEDVKLLTVAGLLHDIGKSKIPESILNKPGKLSSAEFEVIKNHPIYGYNLLQNKGLDKRILNATLQHHERCDGSGYPNKLKGYELDSFAKIVAIADVYDAMTATRDFRNSTCPFKVVGMFEQDLSKYDTKYIMIFLERIVLTYMHNNVRLSDGRIGEVVMINKLTLSKPIVKVGEEFVDLSVEKGLTIESIV